MGQQAGSMKRSTALIRPSRPANQHSFTWRSHRIGTACAVTRGSQNACNQWRFHRSSITTSATCSKKRRGSKEPAFNQMNYCMEAAGIEPASENVPQESLHTYQVPICLAPLPKETCKLAGAPAH